VPGPTSSWNLERRSAMHFYLPPGSGSEVLAMLPIKTILHPTDFSPQAEYAFRLASALARDYNARLIIMHVKMVPAVAYGEFAALPPDAEESVESLKERLTQLKPRGCAVEYVLTEGVPAEEIVNVAGDKHCDLILMGTHGRTGLGRLLMGSVAELVVRKAPCPVLTVKTPVVAEPAEQEPVREAVPVG
jgi:nucleotide-binding universal stress UspA family protein